MQYLTYSPLSVKVRGSLRFVASALVPAYFRAERQLPAFFLHVGLPKTATTTLQNTLFTNHSEVYYLGKSATFHNTRGCRSEQIYEALTPIFWDRHSRLRVPHTRSKLIEHIGNVGDRTLVGSWEGFGQQKNKVFQRTVLNTQAVFDDVRLIFTIRNPLTRLPSAYLQALKHCALHGRHHSLPKGVLYRPFEDWLYRSSPSGHNYHFAFGDNIRFSVQHFGVDKVGVFLFEELLEDPKDFYRRIATFMGIDLEEAQAQEQRHMNPALTTEQVAWLQRIDSSAADRKNWLSLSRKERFKKLTTIRMEGRGEKCRVHLGEEQKAYISKRSQTLNRWIAETFRLDLECHGYPL